MYAFTNDLVPNRRLKKGLLSQYSIIPGVKMDTITKQFSTHYADLFAKHGPTPKGVDWGTDANCQLLYGNMLAVIDEDDIKTNKKISVLDVGCGYGGFYHFAKDRNINLDYYGIDIVKEMVDFAKKDIPNGKFLHQDIFKLDGNEKFDYLVCNGILTLKLAASIMEMDRFSKDLIRKMFSLCNKGIAFNFMTTKVNYMTDKLFYKNPLEIIAFSMNELTTKFKVNHNNPHYLYTVYLYQEYQKMMV